MSESLFVVLRDLELIDIQKLSNIVANGSILKQRGCGRSMYSMLCYNLNVTPVRIEKKSKEQRAKERLAKMIEKREAELKALKEKLA